MQRKWSFLDTKDTERTDAKEVVVFGYLGYRATDTKEVVVFGY